MCCFSKQTDQSASNIKSLGWNAFHQWPEAWKVTWENTFYSTDENNTSRVLYNTYKANDQIEHKDKY